LHVALHQATHGLNPTFADHPIQNARRQGPAQNV